MKTYNDIFKIQAECDDLGLERRRIATEQLSVEWLQRCGSPMPTAMGIWKETAIEPIIHRSVGYATGSGNILELTIDAFPISIDEVPLLTEYEQVSLCGACKGSSGGCPGFAPRFTNISKREENFVVVVVSVDFIWSIMYATPQDGWKTRRIIKQLMYADRLSENYSKRLLKFVLAQDAGRILGLGNCMGCNPKRCTVIRGGVCSHPEQRSFSMEAVGVDCDTLHEWIYDECLPWYYPGTSLIPMYMSRYTGIFPNSIDTLADTLTEFMKSDKSFIPLNQVPEQRAADVMMMQIPRGAHKGDFQYVYDDPGGQ